MPGIRYLPPADTILKQNGKQPLKASRQKRESQPPCKSCKNTGYLLSTSAIFLTWWYCPSKDVRSHCAERHIQTSQISFQETTKWEAALAEAHQRCSRRWHQHGEGGGACVWSGRGRMAALGLCGRNFGEEVELRSNGRKKLV